MFPRLGTFWIWEYSWTTLIWKSEMLQTTQLFQCHLIPSWSYSNYLLSQNCLVCLLVFVLDIFMILPEADLNRIYEVEDALERMIPSASTSQMLRLQGWAPICGLWVWGSNPGLCACQVSGLPPELQPHTLRCRPHPFPLPSQWPPQRRAWWLYSHYPQPREHSLALGGARGT